MLEFVDGFHLDNGAQVPPQQKKISIYKVRNKPTIIRAVLLIIR